jgi:hypothetical protein
MAAVRSADPFRAPPVVKRGDESALSFFNTPTTIPVVEQFDGKGDFVGFCFGRSRQRQRSESRVGP